MKTGKRGQPWPRADDDPGTAESLLWKTRFFFNGEVND